MKKKIWILFMVVSLLLTACAKEGSDDINQEEGFQIYYLNPERTELVAYEYEPEAEDMEGMVEECLQMLANSPRKSQYVGPLLSTIQLQEYTLGSPQISLDFDESYSTLNSVREVLIRAAIVKTLVQIPGVEYVSFYVEGAPLKDAKNNVVGVMTKDSFVNNVGEQINTTEHYEITLYYASEDGKALVADTRSVYASTSVSMEKLVLTYLMQGPGGSKLQGTIPAGTELVSVSTLDGVCFVNFDETFLDYNYKITEEVAWYSVVNSLCEINGINKVQISVNGETNMKFRDKYALDALYERNLDCVMKEE